MKKKLLIAIPAIIAIGIFAGYKFIYKEHRDISAEEAEFSLTTPTLKKEFAESDSLANAKYADKTIVVTGKVTAIDAASHSITVDESLSATMKEKNTADATVGQPVKIKGRLVGYDDLLEELKMDQVSIIK
jgi:ribosomal protein L18E